MADEVTSTVTSTSDGKVEITLEKYQELVAAAAVKAPIVYNTVQKTARMLSSENKMWGAVLMGGGAALGAIGAFVYGVGVRQERKLEN